MKLRENINKLFIRITLNRYWNDPVWSKVIAAGLITLAGFIGTTIYTISISLISNISLEKSLYTLVEFFNQDITMPRFWLLAILILVIIFTFKPIWLFIKSISNKSIKYKEVKGIAQDDVPTAYNISTVMFSDRMASAFPGIRDVTWFNKPSEARKRLEILLKVPLQFRPADGKGILNPYWWFRDTSSMFIHSFKHLSRNKVLMNIEEVKLKRIAAYHGDSYFRDFVYVECYGDKRTGLYDSSKESIEHSKKLFGYCREEFGIIKYLHFWKRFITRADYDDGATVICGKVRETIDAELRVRYLTDYNFIIAVNGSPYNSERFMEESKKYFDGILSGLINPNDFFNHLKNYKKSEY